jgi:hypothetical protein
LCTIVTLVSEGKGRREGVGGKGEEGESEKERKGKREEGSQQELI